MAAPRQESMTVRSTLYSSFLSRNGYSRDFIMYGHDPGLLVVLFFAVVCMQRE